MYLSSAEHKGGHQRIDAHPSLSAADTLHGLVAEVFSEMRSLSARVDTTGGDHDVLVLGERFAFRFPRRGMHGLDLELKLLRHLQSRSQIPTPDYRYVDRDDRFAGYQLISGTALQPAQVRMLGVPARRHLVEQLARFIAALHSTPPEAVAPLNRWSASWTAQAFADRIADYRMEAIVRRFPYLHDPIASFLADYRLDEPASVVVIHGDLVPEHLLFDTAADQFGGIIDFSDVGLGDPAQDFLGLWLYGADFVADAVASYDPQERDPSLLARSQNHYVRYRIDQLFELINDGADANVVALHAAELHPLMSNYYTPK